MKIPNPYFENVLAYGNLCVEEILIEDVYPVLFVLKNSRQQRFICVCCEIREEQRWIINTISEQDLIALLLNKVTARWVFEKGESQIIAIRDYSTKKESFQHAAHVLDVRDLPREGIYLDAEENEFSSYLKRLRSVHTKKKSDMKIFCDYKATMFAFNSTQTVKIFSGGVSAASWYGDTEIFKGDMSYA